MEIDKTYYKRFPTVLRDALLDGRVAFPKSLRVQYEDKQVYRGVRYNQKKTYIDKTDFYSHVDIFLYVDVDISKEFEVIEKCEKNGLT